jgi:hypothetical protein
LGSILATEQDSFIEEQYSRCYWITLLWKIKAYQRSIRTANERRNPYQLQKIKIAKLIESQEKITINLQIQELKHSRYAEDRKKVEELTKKLEELKAVDISTDNVVPFPVKVIATSFLYVVEGKTRKRFKIHTAQYVAEWINTQINGVTSRK